ncbi:MAG: precorrin-6y C5,15-methyltransferase (decarboxylating) subunit CbiE [Syntrophobacteraceae bacterium]|nr:precorrin-6y C5,15-methyltransferase (decarboxylating) subunit CbiE [Syntrophobacteraceae bacterium]
MRPADWKPPLIAVIGLGAGPQWLGARALEWIGASQVLLGSAKHLESFRDHAGEKLSFTSPLSQSVEEIGRISKTKRVAVVCSGDPLFFGIAKTLRARFGKERLLVIPNVTSVQTLCARICENWDAAEAVSFHGPTAEGDVERVLEILLKGRKAAILTDPQHTPQWIAKELIGAGLTEWRMFIGEDLGTDSEKIRSFLPSEAAGMEFSPLNVLLICPWEVGAGPQNSSLPQRIFGFEEEAFERDAGMITKMEVRAVVLATLELEHGQVLWDLGAATGSVSIEAARIARLSQVFAIEKAPARYAKLLKNLEKFGAVRVKAIRAEASGALEGLSAPDRVFIGGSGADLGAILETVSRRLLPGGLVVQTAVLFQTLQTAASFWQNAGFSVSIVQLQVNRSVPTGKELRLEALNPVFILSARRR